MTRKLFVLAALFVALPAQAPQHGIDLSAIDTSIFPGNDFYAYANGAWIARTEIPADRSSVGITGELRDRSDRQVASIVADAARAHAPANSDARRIADLYASYMDEATIESHGTGPLKPYLAAIEGIHNPTDLATHLGETLRADVDALNYTNFHTPNLFGLWVAPGFNDPGHYAPYLLQGGLELPNRDYYLSTSDRMKAIRAAYQAHIAAMLKLAGYDNAESRAAAILALEHSIAERQISLADSENIEKADNPWKMSEFKEKAPGLDWQAYFAAAGLERQPSFIVWQPTAIAAESELVVSVPIEIWKDFLAYHTIESYAVVLPKAFVDESFDFFSKTLSGVTQHGPRDRRAIALVNEILGDAVGQIYAQRYFPPEAKAQAQAIVDNILAAFRARLANAVWMAPATKKEALAKLATLQIGVGYPDHFRSYSGLAIKPNDVFGNVERAELFELSYQIGRLGTPVDRKEWCMEPQTVNAVNLPLHNGLNFPAAYLQPPNFDPSAPAASNYAAIGTTIGHEISHTFDSEGAAFDSRGRVRNWWTPEDLAHFNASTAALAAQYDAYAPFPDLHLNGRQTLGENIADLAGLNAAFDAFHASLQGKTAPTIGGFSPDQQFFLAFAQKFKGKARESYYRRQILTDPHSPPQYRASTVRNIDGWYSAFDVKPGQTLYLAPADRVHIW